MKRQPCATDGPAYPTDLTDAEWDIIEPLLPPRDPRKGGAPQTIPLREIVNAIMYLLRTGIQWRNMPHDFPEWSAVYYHLSKWRVAKTFEKINAVPRERTRCAMGRKPTPSAGVIDSQSVKTTEVGGVDGYDAGKKVMGRKRHICVDTVGLLMVAVVHAANIQDRDGAKLVFEKMRGLFPRLEKVFADGGYAGQLIDWVKATFNWVVEIVKRTDAHHFVVLAKRWVVERTFAWLGRNRRLSKDYEGLTSTSESMIYLGSIRTMTRRLAKAA